MVAAIITIITTMAKKVAKYVENTAALPVMVDTVIIITTMAQKVARVEHTVALPAMVAAIKTMW